MLASLLVVACGAPAPPVTPAPSPTPSVVAPTAVATTPAVEAQQLIDRARVAHGAPGAVALVQRAGTRTWVASGSADADGTPITEATRFRIASITKPIVAALVLDAVARGEVGLDDVVGDILPGVVRPEPPVTVRQLLNHTSGIFDESNGVSTREEIEADIAKLGDPALRAEAESTLRDSLAGRPVIASARVIVGLSETHDRYFAPGTAFHYSNTNYQLAAMLLEAVTGMTLGDVLQARLVGPLGLRATTIAPPDTASPEMRGYGAAAADGTLVDITDDLSWFGNGGNGGIVTTADELLTILQAIAGGTFLPADLTAAMLTADRGYGLGIGAYPFRCGTLFGHQGAVNGTASIAVVDPETLDGAVIAMNRRDGTDPPLPTLAEALVCAAG